LVFPRRKKRKKNERDDFADENPSGRVRERDERARTDMHTRVVVSAARFLSFCSFCSFLKGRLFWRFLFFS
jgi:hypothetical protein